VRVLLVHNFYQSGLPSGENNVYRRERDGLRDRQHAVAEFTRSNDEAKYPPYLAGPEAMLLMPWNPFSAARLRSVLRQFKPDVVHIHNTFPLISPAALHVIHAAAVPLVWTVHNFRPWCAAATLLRDGRHCTLCLDQKSVLPGLRHGCYRGSSAATLPVGAMIGLHQHLQTWARLPDRIIALTAFQQAQLIKAGLPQDKIRVKPNFVVPTPVVPWSAREEKIVYVGRLGHEKGVDLLLDAMSGWQAPPQLEIIGDGRERAVLESLARQYGISDKVKFLGILSPEQTRVRLATARLLVLPSRWWETFGLSVIEAYAQGVPVVAARIAGLPELVRDGITGTLFEPGQADSLRNSLSGLWSQPETLELMGHAALDVYREHYSPEANLERLEAIYEESIEACGNR
jgi:glycosyltransferase involved in cell wall biosynthesis